MKIVESGINSSGIDSKSIDYKTSSSLKKLGKVWYVLEARRKDFQGKKYTYAVVKPTTKLLERFHLERDILVVFTDEFDFAQNDFIIFSNWMITFFLKDKVDKLCVILISKDSDIKSKIKDLIARDSESRIIIPFTYSECTSQTLGNEEDFIIERLKEFFYERNLFDHRSPLCNDTYFFGRDLIVQYLYDRYKSGENSGLFGLRKIGKTSVVYALKRRLEIRNEPVIFIDCESIHLKRWYQGKRI